MKDCLAFSHSQQTLAPHNLHKFNLLSKLVIQDRRKVEFHSLEIELKFEYLIIIPSTLCDIMTLKNEDCTRSFNFKLSQVYLHYMTSSLIIHILLIICPNEKLEFYS